MLKLENFDTGAANPTLNRNHVHKIEVLFPRNPITQRKIAAILTAYDDLIETNKRRIGLLEKMAEELYREWFVRTRDLLLPRLISGKLSVEDLDIQIPPSIQEEV